jgi:predicted protein tyrosine phosphatase
MGVRTVEQFYPSPTDICISIRTPGSEAAALREGWRAVCRVWFNDLPEHQPRTVGGDITPADADAIVGFVWAFRDAKRCIVHCDAGESRSPSVVRALTGSHDHARNPVVFHAVRDAMWRHSPPFAL